MYGLTFEEKVLEEIKSLRDRLDRLENRPTPGTIPPLVPGTVPTIPIKFESKCSKCGLVMDGPMGYCCPHRDCPTGMGPVWCGTTELK